jgi:hypothetical protein
MTPKEWTGWRFILGTIVTLFAACKGNICVPSCGLRLLESAAVLARFYGGFMLFLTLVSSILVGLRVFRIMLDTAGGLCAVTWFVWAAAVSFWFAKHGTDQTLFHTSGMFIAAAGLLLLVHILNRGEWKFGQTVQHTIAASLCTSALCLQSASLWLVSCGMAWCIYTGTLLVRIGTQSEVGLI